MYNSVLQISQHFCTGAAIVENSKSDIQCYVRTSKLRNYLWMDVLQRLPAWKRGCSLRIAGQWRDRSARISGDGDCSVVIHVVVLGGGAAGDVWEEGQVRVTERQTILFIILGDLKKCGAISQN